MRNKRLLEVRNLKTHFTTDDGVARAVDGVSFHILPGEVFGLVGESGSGKTVTAHSIVGILPPDGRQVAGEILFDGLRLNDLDDRELAALRGERIGMIFQDPQVRLNPVFTIGTQLAELFKIHRGMRHEAARGRTIELLEQVGMPDPANRVNGYAHELSGGQAQRVMIALAIALDPDLLIADEPTTALDATIEAQILELLGRLRERRRTAMLLITHDLAVVAGQANQVAVMYAGHFVEQSEVARIFDQPLHPYTQGLLRSMPTESTEGRLHSIPGVVPEAHHWPDGCRFAPRCPAREFYGLEICETTMPDLIEVSPGHLVRCWLYQAKDEHPPTLDPSVPTSVW